jgi:uncharacterized membrane protein
MGLRMSTVGPLEVIVSVVIALIYIGVFALAVYAMIVLAARVLHRVLPASTPPRDPALDDLRSRFARGEIDEAEYRHLRSVLQGG